MTAALLSLHTALGRLVMAGCTVAIVGCAEVPSPTDEDVSPARFQEEHFAAERGITREEARLRLSWQAPASKLQDQLVERIPADSFGGVWIDRDDGDRVKVGIVAPRAGSDAANARQAFDLQVQGVADEVGIPDVVDVVPVQQSLKELDDLGLKLFAATASISPEAKEVMARPERNAVSIRVAPDTSAAEIAQVKAIGAELGIAKLDVVADAQPASRHTTCSYSGGWRNCSPSRAGEALYRKTGTSTYTGRCTMAFAVSRGSTLKARLTAAHCFPSGDTADWYTRTPSGSYLNLGWPSYSYFSDQMDARLIGLRTPSSTNYHRYLARTTDLDKSILGTQSCVAQASVCYSGARSGEKCATVQGCNATAYLNGQQALKLFRINTGNAGGDSGAPMWTSSWAFGILVGGNSTDTYGYSIISVLGALNATLYTGT